MFGFRQKEGNRFEFLLNDFADEWMFDLCVMLKEDGKNVDVTMCSLNISFLLWEV
jgi:hypothetical protein